MLANLIRIKESNMSDLFRFSPSSDLLTLDLHKSQTKSKNLTKL